MPNFRNAGHGVRRRSGSNKSWDGFFTPSPVVIPAASKVLLGSIMLNNPGIDETVLRTVGTLGVASDQSAASEVQIGAFGMIVVSDDALAVGITAIPGPVTGVGEDGWFLFASINQRFLFGSAIGMNPDYGHVYNFDSRAKRKIEDGRVVVLVAENAHATHGFNVTLALRQLSMVSGI